YDVHQLEDGGEVWFDITAPKGHLDRLFGTGAATGPNPPGESSPGSSLPTDDEPRVGGALPGWVRSVRFWPTQHLGRGGRGWWRRGSSGAIAVTTSYGRGMERQRADAAPAPRTHFGRWLHAQLKAAGWTGADLASALGVRRMSVSYRATGVFTPRPEMGDG